MIESRAGGDQLDEAGVAAIQALPEPARSVVMAALAARPQPGKDTEFDGERARVARELHDTIGGDLAASVALFKYYFENPADGQSREKVLRNIFEVLQTTLGSLREMLRSLRLREVGPAGLVGALQEMADAFHRFHGLDVLLKALGPEENLTQAHQEVVFQVVREALSNVRRHSQSSTCLVSCNFGEQPFMVEVKDWGSGILEQNTDGFGLIGMRERAAGIGGRVQVVSSPGRGTTVLLIGPEPSLKP